MQAGDNPLSLPNVKPAMCWPYKRDTETGSVKNISVRMILADMHLISHLNSGLSAYSVIKQTVPVH